MADEARWEKRINQLRKDFSSSPFLAKIVTHYHWFEMALADQIEMTINGSKEKSSPDPQSLSALLFAQTIVEVYEHLSNTGKTSLRGRIRDSIKAETGFSALYLELNIARLLFEAGYEVEFTDLDGFGRYDLRFWNGRAEGEVECKSISTDAGRRIHRKDFYRFMDVIGSEITIRAESGANEVVVITINDRMPSDAGQQMILRSAVIEVLSKPNITSNFSGSFFTIEREPYELHLGSMGATPDNLYKL